jgi:hypothetical protein
MKNFGICYGHLEYLTAIWYIFWTFNTFCGHLMPTYQMENLTLKIVQRN